MIDENSDNEKSTFFATLRKEFFHGPFWSLLSSIAAVLTIFVAFIFGATAYLDRQVNNRVDERMKPFQHMMSALIAENNDDYWGARIELLQVASECTDKDFEIGGKIDRLDEIQACIGQTNFNAFVDVLMFSIVNSPIDDFHEARSEFEALIEVLGFDIASNGWRLQQLGYYYLRHGETTEALEALDESIKRYREFDSYRSTAFPHFFRSWALAYDGDETGSLAEMHAAIVCAPIEFNSLLVSGEQNALLEEYNVAMLAQQNPQFAKTLRNVINQAQALDFTGSCTDLTPATYKRVSE